MVKLGFKKVSQTLLQLKQVSTDAASDLQLLLYLLKEKCCLLTTKRRGKKPALVLKVDYISFVIALKSKICCMVFLKL